MYSINFTLTKKKLCVSLHYIGANSYLQQIVATPLCLENISKYWSTDNLKKIGFTGYVYDFSVDYVSTDVDDIKDIHKYLMEENNIVHI